MLDRQVGQYKLHDQVMIIACGNLESDNAIVNTMSSALISRFAHFTVKVNQEEWLDWARQHNIDMRITSFIGFKPSLLYTFNPDVTSPYASPRTWEMLSKVIKDVEISPKDLVLISSLIGQGVAREFLAYINLYKDIPSINDILKSPENIKIPNNLGMQWAMMGLVCHHIDKDNAETLVKFLERLPMEVQLCAFKEIRARNVMLITTTKLINWGTSLSNDVHSLI